LGQNEGKFLLRKNYPQSKKTKVFEVSQGTFFKKFLEPPSAEGRKRLPSATPQASLAPPRFKKTASRRLFGQSRHLPQANTLSLAQSATERNKIMQTTIFSPVDGTVISLDRVPDEAFASGMLGDGFAVEPENGDICAPAAGKIVSISESRHAYSIAADFGDLLVHIGIDTIELPEAFLPIVAVGDYVAAGQPIARADLDMIKKAGLSPVIPVLITDLRASGTVKKNYGKARGGKDVAMYLTK
jgi:glucose-specific phosphotransferase system IIA component